MNGLVAPRPIAWVSTIGAGRDAEPGAVLVLQRVLVSSRIPTVGIGPGARAGIDKDSLANCRATRRADDLGRHRGARASARTPRSAEFGPEVDEWDGRRRDAGAVAARRAAAGRRVARGVRMPRAPDRRPRQRRGAVERARDRAGRPHLRARRRARRRPSAARRRAPARRPRRAATTGCARRDRFELRRPSSVDPDEVRAALGERARAARRPRPAARPALRTALRRRDRRVGDAGQGRQRPDGQPRHRFRDRSTP